jgi:hypothetical protein
MPWSAKQKKTALAVAHGWKPKGKAKSFGKNLADLIMSEERTGTHRKGRKMQKG